MKKIYIIHLPCYDASTHTTLAKRQPGFASKPSVITGMIDHHLIKYSILGVGEYTIVHEDEHFKKYIAALRYIYEDEALKKEINYICVSQIIRDAAYIRLNKCHKSCIIAELDCVQQVLLYEHELQPLDQNMRHDALVGILIAVDYENYKKVVAINANFFKNCDRKTLVQFIKDSPIKDKTVVAVTDTTMTTIVACEYPCAPDQYPC